MTVFESLMFALAFAGLIISMLSFNKNDKKIDRPYS
ncbi:putative holin-like toxin [Cytobacillus sp. IB215665]|nr:putative holin-like toxin [Cytobacillus sp. IB215665]MDX8366056.1 putative holin-like toxin [Cytobacillus sp. IB215665]